MKRYLLFAGVTYYPSGGWNDLKGSYDNLPDAMEEGGRLIAVHQHPLYNWWHVVDIKEGVAVAWDNNMMGGLPFPFSICNHG